MPAERSVLFLDDEAYRTRLYRQRLEESGWAVELCSNTVEAQELLDDDSGRVFQAAVVDLQMGRPADMDDHAWEQFGHLPGLWWLAGKAARFEIQKTAVAILTNKAPGEIRELVKERVVISRPALYIGLYRKIDVNARQFPDELAKLPNCQPGTLVEFRP